MPNAAVLQEVPMSYGQAATTSIVTAAPAAPCTVGSTIEASFAWGSNATPSQVKDSANQIYTLGKVLYDSVHAQSLAVYVFQNNQSATPLQVTASFAVAQSYNGAGLKEITNVGALQGGTGAPVGNSQVVPGTGANAISGGNVTPTQQPCLLSSTCLETHGPKNAAIAAGTGLTLGTRGFTAGANPWNATESKRLTATTQLAATYTDATDGASAGYTYLTITLLYNEAAAPGGSVQADVVQEQPMSYAAGPATTIATPAFLANCGVGNTVEASFSWGSNAVPTQVEDSAGQVYAAAKVLYDSVHQQSLGVYVFQGNASATELVVTATFAAAQSFIGAGAKEITNVGTLMSGTGAPVGQIQVGPGASNDAVSTGNLIPTAQPCLLSGTVLETHDPKTDAITAGTNFLLGTQGFQADTTPNSATESQRLTSLSPIAATFDDPLDGGNIGYTYLAIALCYPESTAGPPSVPGSATNQQVGSISTGQCLAQLCTPPPSIGDTFYMSNSSPGGFVPTLYPDTTASLAASGNAARQSSQFWLYRAATATTEGPQNVWWDEIAPVKGNLVINQQLTLGAAMASISLTQSGGLSSPEGDTLGSAVIVSGSLPPGCSLSSAGAITGTPTGTTPGTYPWTAQMTDAALKSVTISGVLTTVAAVANVVAQIEQLPQLVFVHNTGTDMIDIAAYCNAFASSFSVSPALPSGAALNTSTGVLSINTGTVGVGSYGPFTFSASDGTNTIPLTPAVPLKIASGVTSILNENPF